MKKHTFLGILFFSGLWGISEAVLGDMMYSRGMIMPASIPLTIIGFVILTFARAYFPQLGIATVIAALTMLYKFFNSPFFGCHLLGILIMGISYDIFINASLMKNRPLKAALAVLGNYTLFAVTITYVFRYEHWQQESIRKVFDHIGIGCITALVCAVIIPLCMRAAGNLKRKLATPVTWRIPWAVGSLSLVTVGLWGLQVAAYMTNIK